MEENGDMERHSEYMEFKVRKDTGGACLSRASCMLLNIPAEDWGHMEP